MNVALARSLPGSLHLARKAQILELLFLAAILWAAHYFNFRSMGLYEDDYSHTSPVLGWQLSDLVDWIRESLLSWDLGRPLGFALGPLLAFMGAKLGGLGGIYAVAYLVQITNAVLFYFLLRRIGHANIALLGSLAFALFPADTTHPFLMHALGLHTSLTFLLLAGCSYLAGRKLLAYVFGLLCLLIYETPYAVFLAIPLLGGPWNRTLGRELLRHLGMWIGILLLVALIRAWMGEGRIASIASSPSEALTLGRHVLGALVIGPAVSLSMFWRGPAWTLSHWNLDLTSVFVACLPILTWMLFPLGIGMVAADPAAPISRPLVSPAAMAGPRPAAPYARTSKLALAGLIMLSLAYGFSFTHYPPTATYGRLTSVHLAGAFGAALVFASLASLLLGIHGSRLLRMGVTVLLAGYLSWVVTYRFSIQQDFVKAWGNERSFWTNLVQQVPDMSDGTIILLTRTGLPETHFIGTHSWADAIMLEQIFSFPTVWSDPPRVFVVAPNWMKSVVRENDQLRWKVPAATWSAHWETLPERNLVLLSWQNGGLVRQQGSLKLHRLTLNLKPIPATSATARAPGPLHPLLISARP